MLRGGFAGLPVLEVSEQNEEALLAAPACCSGAIRAGNSSVDGFGRESQELLSLWTWALRGGCGTPGCESRTLSLGTQGAERTGKGAVGTGEESRMWLLLQTIVLFQT